MSVERYFGIRRRGSTVRTELLGGATTFATMAYIIVVNPAILKSAGFPVGPSTVATILTAVFGCLAMGLYANLPIAVAPYMGENAFLAFGLAAMGITWQQRLGAVFLSGTAFLLLTVFKVRGWLARSISASLKHSFAVGIGLFLAFVGLFESGIVERASEVPVKIGNFRDPRVLVAIGGFALIAGLLARGFRGALFVGILAAGAAGLALGFARLPSRIAAWPTGPEYDIRAIALHLDVAGVLKVSMVPVLLTLFLMSFLDTLGTLVGVGSAAGLLDERGDLPELEKPMLVDAASCVFSSLAGTSTSGAYIESAAGVRQGARTGLASVATAALFAGSLFFLPLLSPLQELKCAYAPALIAVGVLMISAARKIDFDDFTESVPAFATIALMIFTFNVANGLTAGLILAPAMKLAAGRAREVRAGSVVLALLCLLYFVFGLPH